MLSPVAVPANCFSDSAHLLLHLRSYENVLKFQIDNLRWSDELKIAPSVTDTYTANS